jgi:mono/diheme cytochrome c family protein
MAKSLKPLPIMAKKIFLTLCFCQRGVIFLHPFKDIFPHLEPQFVNMISHRSIAKSIFISTLIFLSISFGNNANAQDGKSLFNTNCASCHKMDQNLAGPALEGVEERWGGDRKKLTAWIKNSSAYLKTGDKYANDLYLKYNKVAMNSFEGVLDDAQIASILDYIRDWKPTVAVTPGGDTQTANAGSDNTLLFGILTLILALVALTLLQVNSNLKKLSDEKAGLHTSEPVPFWKNKAYIAMLTVVLFVLGGYLTTKGAIGLGRDKDYQPNQPIYYSHKVHAGTNQINCLYCHGGAEQGKHANIPSVNVCMNCHKAINEYKGDKLYTEDGKEVDGTAEIHKLYEYAGADKDNLGAWDPTKAKSIEWVKIHNLPDHVYFNHSQHVKAGKVQCQTCHGEINKMDEVKQFTDLSMGWCVNCHRETKVQFKENGFYSIYEKFHDEMKNGKLDSTKGITVEKIGGTECQKCHY